jgi:acetyltransferase-like isoleucine patch superfamily enzyme
MPRHPTAIVGENSRIGARTRIWAFVNVCDGAVVGDDCNLCDHVFVENGAFVGNRVTVKTHVSLWTGIALEDDVFIGPGVVFTNDHRPRSRKPLAEFARTIVRRGASIGGGVVVCPGLSIGEYALVGAGSVVTKNVPPYALVTGNPARVRGWVCTCGESLAQTGATLSCSCGKRYAVEDGIVRPA